MNQYRRNAAPQHKSTLASPLLLALAIMVLLGVGTCAYENAQTTARVADPQP
jgi:hypothetical protein